MRKIKLVVALIIIGFLGLQCIVIAQAQEPAKIDFWMNPSSVDTGEKNMTNFQKY